MLKMEGIQTLKGSWPWPWPSIRPYRISSCSSHRPLPIYQISFKLKKLFVDGRTYGRTDGRTDIFLLYTIRSTFGSRPNNNWALCARWENPAIQWYCNIAHFYRRGDQVVLLVVRILTKTMLKLACWWFLSWNSTECDKNPVTWLNAWRHDRIGLIWNRISHLMTSHVSLTRLRSAVTTSSLMRQITRRHRRPIPFIPSPVQRRVWSPSCLH